MASNTKQLWFGYGAGFSNVNVTYMPLQTSAIGIGAKTTYLPRNWSAIPSSSGNISNFTLQLNNPPGVGKYLVAKVKKNNVDTGIEVNISGANMLGSDTVHSVSVGTSDYLQIEFTPGNTPDFILDGGWVSKFTPDVDGKYTYTGSTGTSAIGSGSKIAVGGLQTVLGSSPNFIVPTNGTFTAIRGVTNGTPTTFSGGFAYTTFGLYKNGTLTDGVTVVTGETDVINTISVAVTTGDDVYIQIATNGSSNSAAFDLTFTPSDMNEMVIPVSTTSFVDAVSTRLYGAYGLVGAEGSFSAAALPVVDDWTVNTFIFERSASPGAGKFYRSYMNVDSNPTNVEVNITDTNVQGIATNIGYQLTNGNSFCITGVPNGTPSGSYALWAFVLTPIISAAPTPTGPGLILVKLISPPYFGD